MKRINFIILVIILMLGGVTVFSFFNGDKEKLEETQEAVYNYLINEGYNPSEIKSIRPEYSWKDEERNAYMAFVTFKDEPNVEYLFLYNKEEGIRARESLPVD